MTDEHAQIASASPAQQRKSTLLVAAVFAAICAWQYYRGRVLATQITGGLAAVLFVVAFVPPAAAWFFRRWMGLAMVLGYFSTRILLSLFFYGIMTPLSAVVRLTGHVPMGKATKQKQPSYWQRRERTKQTREGFERAF